MPFTRFPVVLLGPGKVGKAVLERIVSAQSLFQSRFKLSFDVKAICDSTGCVVATDKQQHLDVHDVLAWKESHTFSAHPQGHMDQFPALSKLVGSKSILVDCSASAMTSPLLRWWIENGGNVVLANKKPLSENMDDFTCFTSPENHNRFGYESTVGAGTPFIAALKRIAMAGDVVRGISGTFSGTIGFITSGLEDGKKFSELVLEAHQNGLTEPDPRDDLNGMDVARKALILARTIGWTRNLSDVHVEPLFPASLGALPLSAFMSSLPIVDADYQSRVEAAEANDSVLRYVATVKDGSCTVGLQAVPRDDSVGRLRGTDNIMQVHTDVYYPQPLVLQGAGAGPEVTASGVVGDMVDIALRHLV